MNYNLKPNDYHRPSLDEYFMDIAKLAALRSTCIYRQVGAVLVKNDKIIATGYNGAISGDDHCINNYCKMDDTSEGKYDYCVAVHAEANAIASCAKMGISTDGSVMYSTLLPCYTCSKLLITSGIVEVIYDQTYNLLTDRGKMWYNYLNNKLKLRKFNK